MELPYVTRIKNKGTYPESKVRNSPLPKSLRSYRSTYCLCQITNKKIPFKILSADTLNQT